MSNNYPRIAPRIRLTQSWRRRSTIPTRSVLAWRRRPSVARHGFTLVELLLVISVIVVLASLTVFTLRDARESAKRGRAETQVARIGEMLMTRWEEYEARQIPLPVNASLAVPQAQFLRLRYIQDLQRMEMPDRITDVFNGPVDPGLPGGPVPPGVAPPVTPPALWQRYRRTVQQNGGFAAWTPTNQGAECLYMILQTTETVFGDGTDFLSPSEIGDTDGDGFYEVIDPWGNPIHFLRWAPGFESPIQTHPIAGATRDQHPPDPFDPFQVNPLWGQSENMLRPFALVPLVVSAGGDGELGLITDFEDSNFSNGRFSQAEVGLNPFYYHPNQFGNFQPDPPWAIPVGGNLNIQLGWRIKVSGGQQPYADNIDNHYGINQ